MDPRHPSPTPINTTRKFPRTLREAFPQDHDPNALGISGPPIPTHRGRFARIGDWLDDLTDDQARRLSAGMIVASALLTLAVFFTIWFL